MPAFTIEWHEGCLRNMRLSAAECARQIGFMLSQQERLDRDIMKYERQIERAKRLNKKSFDADKFKDQ